MRTLVCACMSAWVRARSRLLTPCLDNHEVLAAGVVVGEWGSRRGEERGEVREVEREWGGREEKRS